MLAASERLPELSEIESLTPALESPALVSGWRIEVTGKGRYWQFRSGSGKARHSAYGGKFGELSDDRKDAYQANKKTHSRSNGSRGPRHTGKRDQPLPGGGTKGEYGQRERVVYPVHP